MRLRSILLAGMVAALVAMPAVAFGWGNGASGPDSYGTHDWVVDQAVRLAGPQGSWVDLGVALAATDDPDTLRVDSRLHVFREKGTGRGAAQAVADLYAECVAAYHAGDTAGASRSLGQLAHYFSDANQPFHAVYDGLRYHSALAPYGDLHLLFESAIDRETTSSASRPEWVVVRSPRTPKDVRATTIAAARYARTLWSPLKTAMLADAGVVATDAVVVSSTSRALARACSDLADIIRAVPAGAGLAPSPARVRLRVTPVSPAPTSSVGAYATCTDALGRGMEGVRVDFTWPTSSGIPATTSAFTDYRGVAVSWWHLDGLTLFRRVAVRAAAPTVGRTTRTATTSFVPTPRLATGRTGFVCVVGPLRPKQGTTVTAAARVRGADGLPVAGLTVRFQWRYATKTVTVYVKSDAAGIAKSVRYIGRATPGRTVLVTARVVSGGSTRTSTASFVPR